MKLSGLCMKHTHKDQCLGVQNLVEVVEGLETLKCLEIIDLADNLVILRSRSLWFLLFFCC